MLTHVFKNFYQVHDVTTVLDLECGDFGSWNSFSFSAGNMVIYGVDHNRKVSWFTRIYRKLYKRVHISTTDALTRMYNMNVINHKVDFVLFKNINDINYTVDEIILLIVSVLCKTGSLIMCKDLIKKSGKSYNDILTLGDFENMIEYDKFVRFTRSNNFVSI